MKNIFKATLAVAAVAAIGMGSFKAYTSYTASNSMNDDLISENVLALAEGGQCRYTHLQGKPQKCTMSIYISMKTGASYNSESAGKAVEGNVEFKKEKVQGIYDTCPERGTCCDPYSCQQVAY